MKYNYNMEDYNKLINEFTLYYQSEFGERKFRKVTQKIMSSKFAIKQLYLLSNSPPNYNEIVHMVMSIPFFMVSKKESVILACLQFLEMWNQTYNNDYYILNNEELYNLSSNIINYCKHI